MKIEVHLIVQRDNTRNRKHISLYTVYLYNEQEYEDLRNGLYRAKNCVLQGRT